MDPFQEFDVQTAAELISFRCYLVGRQRYRNEQAIRHQQQCRLLSAKPAPFPLPTIPVLTSASLLTACATISSIVAVIAIIAHNLV